MASILLPSLPLIALLTALLFKRGAIVSSMLGMLTALVVIFYDHRYTLSIHSLLATDLPIVLLLTLSVALVIVPGQILNSLLRSTNTMAEIGARIKSIPLSSLKMASIVVLGVAPALESLTGFGVSLFFTVPILMQLFSIRKALLLSLLSMNIMPWGTLALATLIGAQLSAVPFSQLAVMTSWSSCLVFPAIGWLVFMVCRERNSPYTDLFYPLLLGLTLSSTLIFYTLYTTAELAGIYAGLSTVLVGLLYEWVRGRQKLLVELIHSQPSLFVLFRPYLVLILLIIISRIPFIHRLLQDLFSLENGGVRLFVFTSPGVFIFLTVLVLFLCSRKYRYQRQVFADGIKRSCYPVLGIMLFSAFAQIHRASGLFTDIAERIVNLSLTETAFISPLLGMLSGYTTGSNVGGNVLFMALQSETGTHFQHHLIFSALQNSSAGHAVFMSLPIILLTLSIATTTTDCDSRAAYSHQNWLVQRALLCAPLIYAALVLPFYLLVG